MLYLCEPLNRVRLWEGKDYVVKEMIISPTMSLAWVKEDLSFWGVIPLPGDWPALLNY